MSSALAQKEEYCIPAPELRGAPLALFDYPELEIGVDGPAGCIAGETRIYNPVTGEHTPVKELYEKGIAPIVQTLMGAIQAGVPFKKGVRDLYRVTLASGRQCIVTGNHIFLTSNGWGFLSSCEPGTRLLISSPCPLPTTEALGPSVSLRDALRLSQKPLSSQEYYSAYSRPYDVQPPLAADSGLVPVPSQGGALSHSHVDSYEDDRETLSEYSHQGQRYDPHARKYSSPLLAYMAYIQSHAQPETSSPTDASFQYDGQSLRGTRPLESIALFPPDDDSTRLHALLLGESRVAQEVLTRGALVDPTLQQLMPYSLFADTTQESTEIPLQLRVYNPSSSAFLSLQYTCKCDYTIQWDTVSSIEYERTDEYFDLHVPIAEHYLAEGIWHHNTGKTFGILYIIHVLLLSYPGTKWLIARKRNTDLAGSALATFRESILDEHEGIRFFGGSKERPPGYIYPNGSFLAVNGLDKPGKIKSMDFDGIYINEATDCDLEDIETCHIRLARRKSSVLPQRFQKLIMDFNPDAPEHWLNQRMEAGLTRRLLSRHEDNPFLWDSKTRDWTEDGRRYIAELDTLTGVLLDRYRRGLWSRAHGTIYQESWDRARNVIERFPIPREWPRYLGIDFGYSNPFVCKWYALDPDGRLIVYREIYMSQKIVEDHCKDIAIASGWFHLLPTNHPRHKDRPAEWADPLPREVIGDHDAEDRATFERHLGLYVTPAKKTVSDGIQAVQARLRPAGDGKPRLLYFRDCLVERDPLLVKRKRPTCSIEEFNVYVWRKSSGGDAKEEPEKENDHGMDTDRYVVARFDLFESGVRYHKNIWN